MKFMSWDYQQLQRCPASRVREIVRVMTEMADQQHQSE